MHRGKHPKPDAFEKRTEGAKTVIDKECLREQWSAPEEIDIAEGKSAKPSIVGHARGRDWQRNQGAYDDRDSDQLQRDQKTGPVARPVGFKQIDAPCVIEIDRKAGEEKEP